MSANRLAVWRKMTAPMIGLGLGLAMVATAGAAVAQPASSAPLAGAAAAQPFVMPPISLRADQVALLQRTLAQAETHGFEHDAFAPSGFEKFDQSPRLRQIIFRQTHRIFPHLRLLAPRRLGGSIPLFSICTPSTLDSKV